MILTVGSRLSLKAALAGVLFLSGLAEAAPPAARKSKVIGTYLNEGPHSIELNVISKDGADTSIINLWVGRIARVVITEGWTKVYTPSESMASRRLLSTRATPTPESAPEFFEKKSRTFYFRVVGGKVTLVRPQDLTVKEKERLRTFKRELQAEGVYDNVLRRH
jgi:hypothetical protein